MPILFCFTDAPRLNDKWQTELDVDVLIHTRPPLIAQRDRIARAYGSQRAQDYLQICTIRGLKTFGYELFPRLSQQLYDFLDALRFEAYSDFTLAYFVLAGYSLNTERFNERQAELFDATFDTEESVARFVAGPLVHLANYNPLERMSALYAQRAARVGEELPYATNACEILARAFGGDEVIYVNEPRAEESEAGDEASKSSDASSNDTDAPTARVMLRDVSGLHAELLADMIGGLCRRLADNPDFLDRILEKWVVPRVEEAFHEIGPEIDAFLANYPDIEITREEFIRRGTASPEWLELARKLGSPVPEPEPGPRT